MFYRFVCAMCRLFFRLFFRPTFKGLENVPVNGPLIICSNHISMLDMFLFGPMLPRRIYFMAKEELFKIPLLGYALKELGAYPVKRGHGDLSAAKTTLKLLHEGKAVGIFPEGTRRKKIEGRLKPKSGAILFALESGTPILPVCVSGNYRIFSRIKVVYGQPFNPISGDGTKASKTEMQDMADSLMGKIYSLI